MELVGETTAIFMIVSRKEVRYIVDRNRELDVGGENTQLTNCSAHQSLKEARKEGLDLTEEISLGVGWEG